MMTKLVNRQGHAYSEVLIVYNMPRMRESSGYSLRMGHRMRFPEGISNIYAKTLRRIVVC